ncbi:MAG: hypothetical protein GF383_03835 [Candidatus Lokiarchaeota archaeon]|nr:hypothetical protein [Candidatus Lokiarchaeota archaeon]MBD3338835.1 hypothetical protein [Candidatus Lokiarchaeota archaeon]
MNSIERVKRALNFNKPDKVPVWKPGSGDVFVMIMVPSENWQPGHIRDEYGLFPHPSDEAIIRARLWEWKKPEWAENNSKYEDMKWLDLEREEIDIWGCIWERKGGITIGHPSRPSLTNWKDLENYLEKYTPDPFDKSQYSPFFINRVNRSAKNKYRVCTLGYLGPLQTAANIRGFTNFLVDHKRNPDKLKHLLDHLTKWNIEQMDAWIKHGAKPHAFLILEDLGTQQGPFFNPQQFEKFYKPMYETLFKAAHERGCDMIQHCCGKIDPIIPYLIEWGLDALELDSPRMTGYNNLRKFRGELMFWGCVNIQSIYTRGTPQECEREVWHMVKNLGTTDGGYGAYFYPQSYHINAPSENVAAFNRGLRKYGVYKKIPPSWWEFQSIKEWKDDFVPKIPPNKTS